MNKKKAASLQMQKKCKEINKLKKKTFKKIEQN